MPRKGNSDIRDEEKFEKDRGYNKLQRRSKEKNWEDLKKDKKK